MANWEKLIEENYARKNKIIFSELLEIIDEEIVEQSFQQGAIEGHSSRRMSTKGRVDKKGEPFDEDPPVARAKSAPAGFGALEENTADIDSKVLTAIKGYLQSNPAIDVEEINITGDDKLRKIMVPAFTRTDQGMHQALKSTLEAEFPGKEILVVVSSGNPVGFVVKDQSGGRKVNLAKYAFKPVGRSINKGDIAEGILGAALFAKFMNPQAEITNDMIISILEQVDSMPDKLADNEKKVMKDLSANRKREDGTTDSISVRIALSAGNFKALMDPKWRAELSDKYSSSVAYVNREDVLDATQREAMDGQPSTVEIISDGVSEQKGTKVDVKVLIDGVATSLGMVSLKAGSATMGQVGSGSWDLIAGRDGFFGRMFLNVAPNPALEEPWREAYGNKDADKVLELGFAIYEDVFKQIQGAKGIQGDNEDFEADFLEKMMEGIKYAATLGEEGVKLVDFVKGDYKILNFDNLKEDILEKIDLDVVFKPSKYPRIFIVDKATGAALIQIRMRTEGTGKLKNVRHYVEKEPKLSQLLDVSKKANP